MIKKALNYVDKRINYNVGYNFWPDLTREFETYESIVANFCIINGLAVSTFKKYIKDLGLTSRLDILSHITGKNVDKFYYLDGFLPKLTFSPPGYLAGSRRKKQSINICKKCISLRYHSIFHEQEWIIKCPFHFLKFEQIYIKKDVSSKLMELFKEQNTVSPIDYNNKFMDRYISKSITRWIYETRNLIESHYEHLIWSDYIDRYEDDHSIAINVGFFYKINPPTDIVKRVLAPACYFDMDKIVLDETVSPVLDEVLKKRSFEEIFEVFRVIEGVSKDSPLNDEINEFTAALKKHHGNPCNWHGVNERFGSKSWIRLCEISCASCPVHHVLYELDDAWIKSDRKFLSRYYFDVVACHMSVLDELEEAHVYKRRDSTSRFLSKGYEGSWLDDSLYSFLSKLSFICLESFMRIKYSWLREIKRGVNPGNFPPARECIHLVHKDGVYNVYRWSCRVNYI